MDRPTSISIICREIQGTCNFWGLEYPSQGKSTLYALMKICSFPRMDFHSLVPYGILNSNIS
uniref:Uncharacterized protein n=1 Tax=Lepeophtheirus salmonis TaxID=72036 RepID=A0A0K2UDF4_LEPSM